MQVVTIQLDERMERDLDDLCRATGRTRSDVVEDALRRRLAAFRFHQLRGKAIPYAEMAGYFTDEDVFRDVS